MSTAPWSASALSYIGGPLGTPNSPAFPVAARVVTRAGDPVATLDVTGGRVTFDDEWSPYVQATITAVAPDVTIDPRLGHRVVIDVGYTYPTGEVDVHQLANLGITSADITRDTRGVVLSLSAQSDEALVQEAAHHLLVDLVNTYPNHATALTSIITAALDPFAPTFVSTLTGTSALMTDYTINIGDEWWSHVESIRDTAAARVYCDEARVWHIESDDAPPPIGFEVPFLVTAEDMQYADYLASFSGWPPQPTVTQFGIERSRQEWANTVVLEHVWTDPGGGANRVARSTAITAGAMAPASVGYRVHKQRRDVPTDIAALDAACESVLIRVKDRGERRTVTARANYWLRPGVDMRALLDGEYAEERITRVTFDLDGSGLMHLRTRHATTFVIG